MTSRTTTIILALAIMLVLYACGGGSGGSGGEETSKTPVDTYSAIGFVQKGPFISGSSITIQELDNKLDPTGISYQTETIDDFGSFSIGSKIKTKYVEIIATGYYFNEVHM